MRLFKVTFLYPDSVCGYQISFILAKLPLPSYCIQPASPAALFLSHIHIHIYIPTHQACPPSPGHPQKCSKSSAAPPAVSCLAPELPPRPLIPTNPCSPLLLSLYFTGTTSASPSNRLVLHALGWRTRSCTHAYVPSPFVSFMSMSRFTAQKHAYTSMRDSRAREKKRRPHSLITPLLRDSDPPDLSPQNGRASGAYVASFAWRTGNIVLRRNRKAVMHSNGPKEE
jgi:hypothetical protein